MITKNLSQEKRDALTISQQIINKQKTTYKLLVTILKFPKKTNKKNITEIMLMLMIVMMMTRIMWMILRLLLPHNDDVAAASDDDEDEISNCIQNVYEYSYEIYRS